MGTIKNLQKQFFLDELIRDSNVVLIERENVTIRHSLSPDRESMAKKLGLHLRIEDIDGFTAS